MIEILKEIDFSILKYIHSELGNKFLDILCPILRSKTTWIPLYLLFIWFLWKRFSRDSWKFILTAIVLVVCSDLLCAQVLKPIIHRMRPCQMLEFSSWLRTFSLCSQTYSFPSCHAMNHATLASFLYNYIPKPYRWLLLVWVLSISFSQVYIGVHFPLDVLGGMFVGLLLGYIGSRWIEGRINNRNTLPVN